MNWPLINLFFIPINTAIACTTDSKFIFYFNVLAVVLSLITIGLKLTN